MSQENRADTMAVKLGAYAQRAGALPDTIVAAYQMSVAKRLAVLGDVFHPDLLHPARTALILLEDTGAIDETVLAAAALCETEFPAMHFTRAEIADRFGSAVAEKADGVPIPGDDDGLLLEQLVTAPPDVALIAVAERLDHARHLHFRDTALWAPFHRQITGVYLPFSARISEQLQRRLERWSGAFEKRYMRAV